MFAGANAAAAASSTSSSCAGYALHRPTQPRRSNPAPQVMPTAFQTPMMFNAPMPVMPPQDFYAGSKLKSGAQLAGLTPGGLPLGVGFATPMATSNSMMLGQTQAMPGFTPGAPSGGWNPSAQPWTPSAMAKDPKAQDPKAPSVATPTVAPAPVGPMINYPSSIDRSDSPLRNFTAQLATGERRPPSPVRPPSPTGPSGQSASSHQNTIVQSLLPQTLGSSQCMEDAGGPTAVNLSALLQMVRQPKSVDQE